MAEIAAGKSGSQLEETIAAVWKDILRTGRVGLDDNFFDLGGDSLLLVAMHSKLQKILQVEIKLTDLFAHTTIRSLAKNLGAAAPSFDAVYERAEKQRSAFAMHRQLRAGEAA
jgi:acyl carrier protein